MILCKIVEPKLPLKAHHFKSFNWRRFHLCQEHNARHIVGTQIFLG